MVRFFSSESLCGTETSMGFANDTIVFVFSSKKARDNYVKTCNNLSCQAIKKSQVSHEATNDGVRPRPFSTEYWGIEPASNDSCSQLPKGLLGFVSISDPYLNFERVF